MSAIKHYFEDWIRLFDRVWFQPRDARMVGILRILTGMIIFYNHLAWTSELTTFFGHDSIIPGSYRRDLNVGPCFAWSHFDWLPGDGWLLPVHVFTLLAMACFTIGLFSRTSAILSAFFVISYANRATGALFGLDQIAAFMTLYLAIAPCGDHFSLDAILRQRQGRGVPPASIQANLSLRLIQVHLCVVYFFAGIGKLQGDTWWNGTAIWYAFASHEYQTMDMTWTAAHLGWINLVTYVSLLWEVSYPFLIWPRLTRPLWLALAVLVHLGIGFAMGMLTFGFIMIVANLAFVPESWLDRILPRRAV
jgi:hypothetical protein